MRHWSSVVKWPTEQAKVAMRQRVEAQGFDLWRNCVGIIDGTLIVLKHAPPLPRHEMLEFKNYRKQQYGLQATVICDDRRRITQFSCHLPGAAHDARAYRLIAAHRSPETHFTGRQFLLADAAYPLSPYCITPFKAPRNGVLSKDKKKFNRHLSGLRITIEHTIGILKERFASLQGLPHRIRGDKDKRSLLKWIGSCVILHNLLRDQDDLWVDDGQELDTPPDEEAYMSGSDSDGDEDVAGTGDGATNGIAVREAMFQEFKHAMHNPGVVN